MPVASTAWALPTETDEQSTGGGPFVRASVYGIYSQHGVAWLYMGATIVGAGPERGIGINGASGYDYDTNGWDVFAPWSTTDSENVSGLALVDSRSQKAYLVAREPDGDCICSRGSGAVDGSPIVGGSTTLLRMAFTGIPASLDRLDVVFPRIGGVLSDVPVTHRPVPEVLDSLVRSARTPTPEDTYPPVLVSRMRSHDLDSADSVVRQLNLGVATLDRSITEEHNKVILAADVLFAFDKSTLTKKARSRIRKAATVVRKRATGTVHVNGYTDSKGSKAYNLRLSGRRAQAVRSKLAGLLNDAELRLVARGKGQANPVAPNTTKGGGDNPEGRALNRRVEVRYTPEPEATHTPTPEVTTTRRPRPTGTPTPARTVARHKAQFEGGDVDSVVEIYRLNQHGNLVTLDFGVRIPRSSAEQGAWDYKSLYDLTMPGRSADVSGVTLADDDHRRLYLPGRYRAADSVIYELTHPQQCLCSTSVSPAGDWDPYGGQTMYLSATYAAPPAGVKALDVRVRQGPLSDYPNPIVLHDIPIEGR
ncbi:MAG: OmpA family protein [Streptosporangiaceae bacterium]